MLLTNTHHNTHHNHATTHCYSPQHSPQHTTLTNAYDTLPGHTLPSLLRYSPQHITKPHDTLIIHHCATRPQTTLPGTTQYTTSNYQLTAATSSLLDTTRPSAPSPPHKETQTHIPPFVNSRELSAIDSRRAGCRGRSADRRSQHIIKPARWRHKSVSRIYLVRAQLAM